MLLMWIPRSGRKGYVILREIYHYDIHYIHSSNRVRMDIGVIKWILQCKKDNCFIMWILRGGRKGYDILRDIKH